MFHNSSFSNLLFNLDVVSRPNNWSILIGCVLLLILTLLLVTTRNKYILSIRALYSQRFYAQLMREGKILYERVTIFAQLFNLMTFAYGILCCLDHFNNPLVEKLSYIGLYGVVFLTLTILYFLKLLINSIYVYLFDHPKERYTLNLYKFIFLTNAAVVLFPFLILSQTIGRFYIIHAYVIAFAVLFILFVYKLMKINPQKISLFHFFIYFCTLEILPYLLLFRFISIY